MAEQWADVQKIFDEALKRKTEERTNFLDEACGGDVELRAEVESLLAHHQEASTGFMQPPDPNTAVTAPLREPPPDPLIGSHIGHFHIKRLIAAGGMGRVYLAQQEHPRRTVALKIMKPGIASSSALRRFEYESQILARLRHPGIAQVYEAGTHDEGSGAEPYFAMEYIPNAKPITEHADQKKLGTKERLELFAKVCDAVHHGHQKGIIHRDLKPGNILVDSGGQPKVIDFGVARATDSDMAVTTLQTDLGQLIGTLQYMSPEQCDADPHDLDTRSDVYSLGVILYELLCGQVPYDISRAALHEAARVIREESPAKPSTINRTLRGDVETITLKALEKDRDRRYQSAADLAQDLQRHLRDEPIEARRPSVGYQIKLFARRNRAAVGAITAVGAILVMATAISLISAVRALRAETDAQSLASSLRVEVQVRRTAERRATQAARNAEWKTYTTSMVTAEYAINNGEITAARRRLDDAPKQLRDWEWRHLSSQLDQSSWTLEGHYGEVELVAFSSDGTKIVSGAMNDSLRYWEVATGQEVFAQPMPVMRENSYLNSFALSSDHEHIIGSAYPDIGIWEVTTGALIRKLREPRERGFHTSVAISPDGSLIAAGSFNTPQFRISIWEAATGKPLHTFTAHEGKIYALAFSPDGRHLASGSWDNTVRIWNSQSGQELAVLRGHTGSIYSIELSPDGDLIASSSADGTVIIWDLASGDVVAKLERHRSRVYDIAFDPTGSLIAGVLSDKTIRIWNAHNGVELVVLRGHERRINCIAFSPNGEYLVTGASFGIVKVWEVPGSIALSALRGHSKDVQAVTWSPDGKSIYSLDDHVIRLWDCTTGTQVAGWRPTASAALQLDPDQTTCIAVSSDGRLLASGSKKGTITLWSTTTGAEVTELTGHTAGVNGVAFSPDDRRIASVSRDRTVRIWDRTNEKESMLLGTHNDEVNCVAFSPDGMLLATGSVDNAIKIWDLDRGDSKTLSGHHSRVICVAFSPDGRQLASGSGDYTVRLWDVERRVELFTLPGHGGAIQSVAFGPDGTRLVSGSKDFTLRLWDTQTGASLLTLRGHRGRVNSCAFSPDGTRIASAASDGTVRLWDEVPLPSRVVERRSQLAARRVAESIVDRLFSDGADAEGVADQLRANEGLSDDQRRQALYVVLQRAVPRRELERAPEPDPVDFSVPADFDKTGFLTSTRDGLYLVSLAGESTQVVDSDGEPLFGLLSEINGEIFLYSRFGRSRSSLIRKIDTDGEVLETIPVPNEVRGPGFAALPDSHFAILDNANDNIHLVDGEGKLLKTVAMPRLADGRSDGHWQTTRGVVVNNNLVVSEDGFRRIFTVDLETYEVSVLRDLRAAGPRKWLGALAYDQGVYYICDSNTIFSFSGGGLLKEIVTLPKGNITGILVEGNAAWVTINFTGEIHQIDLRSGKARVITKGLRSPKGLVWVLQEADAKVESDG